MNVSSVLSENLLLKDEIRHETLEIYDATVLPTTSSNFEKGLEKQKQQFESHQRKHTTTKSHQCGYCGQKFPKIDDLRSHEEIHLNEAVHKCEFCKMKFYEMQQLNEHISTKHGSEQRKQQRSNKSRRYKQKAAPEFGCFDCKKIFTTRANLKRHQKSQHDENCLNEVEYQPNESMPPISSDEEVLLNDHTRNNHFDQNKVANDQDKSHEPVKRTQKTRREKSTAITSQIDHINQVNKVVNHKRLNETHSNMTTILKKDMIFECFICKKRLKTVPTLESHLAVHDGKFQCKICLKALSNADNLKTHMLIHTSEKPFQCDECPRKFRTKHQIPGHKLEHHSGLSGMKFECFDCKKRFPKLSRLTSHQISHMKAKVFKCNYCNQHFTRKPSRTLHEKRYHLHTKPIPKWKNYYVERTFKCTQCPKMFKRKDHLNSHVKSIHSTERPFNCQFCDKTFKLKEVLNLHLRIHTKEKPFKCSFCPKSFAYGSSKKSHEKVAHTKHKPYECQFCSDRFFFSVQVLVHIRSQHFDVLRKQDRNTGKLHELFLGRRTYECFWCKLAGTSNTIKNHMPLCRGPKIYKCSICVKKFSSLNKLSKHKSEHECDVCKFQSNNIYQLRRHKRQHGTKQFTCIFCPMAFYHKGNLDLHLDVHTKPLKCDNCGWRCAKAISLARHISGNRCGGPMKNRKKRKKTQYECFMCHASFVTHLTLRHHITYIHGERNIQCNYCSRKFYTKTNLRNHEKYHTNKLPCDFCSFQPKNRFTRFLHIWREHLEAFKSRIEEQSKSTIVKLQYDSRLKIWN